MNLCSTQFHQDGTCRSCSSTVSAVFFVHYAWDLVLLCVANMSLPIDQELISPSFSRATSESISSPSDLWIKTCLSDPCMFHAVLLTASSHLDTVRGEWDNQITCFHRRSTTKLLLSNISSWGGSIYVYCGNDVFVATWSKSRILHLWIGY